MSRFDSDLLPPRILIVDDERQIHASLRLRLAQSYELVFCYNAKDGLRAVTEQRFDLCLADIHMPQMDGLRFIDAASRLDRDLGFVVLSGFDSDDNLRRAIPLQVYDFIGKPLPDRHGFEARFPEWIARTRERRRDHLLAEQAGRISQDLDSARLEREVELVASASARDALRQTSGLLTTIHAHLVSATTSLSTRTRVDPALIPLLRSLDEARKTATAAIDIAATFFDTSYGNRDASPALVNAGLRHAVSIATRMAEAEQVNKVVDCQSQYESQPIRGISGIDFLLMMTPAIAAALVLAPQNSTIRVSSESLTRLDAACNDPRFRNHLWTNRKSAFNSSPGILIVVGSPAGAWTRTQTEAWLRGQDSALPSVTARGLVGGVQKCRGLLGVAVAPAAAQFRIVIAVPT